MTPRHALSALVLLPALLGLSACVSSGGQAPGTAMSFDAAPYQATGSGAGAGTAAGAGGPIAGRPPRSLFGSDWSGSGDNG